MSAINREDAIKELMSWLPKLENGLFHWTGVKAMLENLPEADYGWISVEDRLPEEDGTLGGYLASIGNWVGILCFVEGKFMEWTLANGLKEPEFPVTAWMPLPKPYQTKEKKHDND